MLPGLLQIAVPTVEEEAIYVALDQKDAALAHPLGVFVLGAVDLLTAELGLAGGPPAMQGMHLSAWLVVAAAGHWVTGNIGSQELQ
jgi:hypothetical protein